MPTTPQKIDVRPGDRVRVTIEKTVQATWSGRRNRPGGVVFLGEFGEWKHFLTDGDDREVVAYEVIQEARPAFLDGDVVASTNHPHNLAVRHNGVWRWTDELDSIGWSDKITEDQLGTGYKTAIRIGGKSSAAQS